MGIRGLALGLSAATALLLAGLLLAALLSALLLTGLLLAGILLAALLAGSVFIRHGCVLLAEEFPQQDNAIWPVLFPRERMRSRVDD